MSRQFRSLFTPNLLPIFVSPPSTDDTIQRLQTEQRRLGDPLAASGASRSSRRDPGFDASPTIYMLLAASRAGDGLEHADADYGGEGRASACRASLSPHRASAIAYCRTGDRHQPCRRRARVRSPLRQEGRSKSRGQLDALVTVSAVLHRCKRQTELTGGEVRSFYVKVDARKARVE